MREELGVERRGVEEGRGVEEERGGAGTRGVREEGGEKR
jgi:hypothetical protein